MTDSVCDPFYPLGSYIINKTDTKLELVLMIYLLNVATILSKNST